MIGACLLTRSSPVTSPTLASPELRGQPPVRLLREHPQRRRVDAAARSRRGTERVVRLAGVRRAEVRDHRLRLGAPLGQDDGQAPETGLRAARAPPLPLAPAGALLAPPSARPLRPGGSGGWSCPEPAAPTQEADDDEDQRVERERPGLDAGDRRSKRSVIARQHERLAEQEQEDREDRADTARTAAPRA